MLQSSYKTLSVAVSAFAITVLPAVAQDVCDLTNGYEASPVAFSQEAEACLEGLDGINPDTFLENEIRSLTLSARSSLAAGDLESLAALNEAARLHAFDMAYRDYAAHEDPEGRGHIDRIQILDRQHLIGATGANITIVPSGTSAADAFAALVSDTANADNLKHEGFSHLGIGAAEADGRIYIVQLFTRVDGKLKSPVSIQSRDQQRLAADFTSPGISPRVWRLKSASGDILASGPGTTFDIKVPTGTTAMLSVDIDYGGDIYTLRGPAISG